MFAIKPKSVLAMYRLATQTKTVTLLKPIIHNQQQFSRGLMGKDCDEKYKLVSKTAAGEDCICWDNLFATMDDIPKERQCWYTVYRRNNYKYSWILAIGTVLFLISAGSFASTVKMLSDPTAFIVLEPEDFGDADEEEADAAA